MTTIENLQEVVDRLEEILSAKYVPTHMNVYMNLTQACLVLDILRAEIKKRKTVMEEDMRPIAIDYKDGEI